MFDCSFLQGHFRDEARKVRLAWDVWYLGVISVWNYVWMCEKMTRLIWSMFATLCSVMRVRNQFVQPCYTSIRVTWQMCGMFLHLHVTWLRTDQYRQFDDILTTSARPLSKSYILLDVEPAIVLLAMIYEIPNISVNMSCYSSFIFGSVTGDK